MEKDAKLIFRLPAGLHENFKDACLSVGMGMSDVLRQMVAQFSAAQGMLDDANNKENDDAKED